MNDRKKREALERYKDKKSMSDKVQVNVQFELRDIEDIDLIKEELGYSSRSATIRALTLERVKELFENN